MNDSRPLATLSLSGFLDRRRVLALLPGMLLVLLGAVLPRTLFVREAPAAGAVPELLSLGGVIFKAALVVLGILVAAGNLAAPAAAARPRETPAFPAPPGLLGLILAGAFVLRVVHLDSGLWYDEVVTLVNSLRAPLPQVLTIHPGENQHLFYTLLAKASVALLGEHNWSVRLPAMLLGVASIAILWNLGRRVTSPRETLLAMAFLAVSYHHVWFSQNARGYTGMLFFTVLGTDLFLAGLRESRARRWMAYGVVAALALYTHLSALFVFVGHGVVWALALAYQRLGRRGGERRIPCAGPLYGLVFGAAATCLCYAPFIPQIWQSFVERFHAPARPADIDLITLDYAQPAYWLAKLEEHWLLAVAALVGGGLALTGLVSYARRSPLVTLLFVVPVGLAAAVILVLGRHIYPRFFFFAAGFAALILMRGVMVVGCKVAAGGASPRGGTLLAACLLAASSVHLLANYRLPKQDFEGVVDYVEAHREAGDVVLTTGLAAFPFHHVFAPQWREVRTVEELQETLAGGHGIWLVYYNETYMRTALPEIRDVIGSSFRCVREFPGTVGDGTLFVCRRVDSGAPSGGPR